MEPIRALSSLVLVTGLLSSMASTVAASGSNTQVYRPVLGEVYAVERLATDESSVVPEPAQPFELHRHELGGENAAVLGTLPPALTPPSGVDLGFEAYSTGDAHPEDPNIAVGPTRLLYVQNGVYSLYDKSGGYLASPCNDAHTSCGNCFLYGVECAYLYDPRALYDPHTGHFIISTAFGSGFPSGSYCTTPNKILLAVSKSSAPSNFKGGASPDADWWIYEIDAVGWVDHPWLGVDHDNVYVSGPEYDADTCSGRATVRIIPKHGLLVGSAPSTVFLYGLPPSPPLTNPETGWGYAIAAGINFDLTATVLIGQGTRDAGAANGNLTVFTVNDAGGAPTLSAANLTVPGIGNPFPPNCPQPGGPTVIDTASASLSLHTVQRNGHVWAAHNGTDAGDTRAEVRWYEIDPAVPALVQSGAITDPNACYFDPSIMPDGSANMTMVMSASGPSLYGSAVFTRRAAGDAAGTTTVPEPLKVGEAYVGNAQPVTLRWGDYGGIAADPVTDDIWIDHEYAKLPCSSCAGTTSVWIGKLTALPSSCGTCEDDGNPCTTELCEEPGGCVHRPIDGVACADDGDPCTTDVCRAGACEHTAVPRDRSTCYAPMHGSLRLRERKGTKLITWRWSGAPGGIYGDPSTMDYALCVYGGADFGGTRVPAGALCDGKPCWTAVGSCGWRYRDPDSMTSALRRIDLRCATGGARRIVVNGDSPLLSLPDLPLATPVTVQLINGDRQCWTADCSKAHANDETRFQATCH